MKSIVWAVIVSLVMSGTAWAQVTETEQTNPCVRPQVYNEESWALLTYDQKASVCQQENQATVVKAMSGALNAKPVNAKKVRVKTGEWLSPKLAVTGLLTAVVGMSVALHFGEDNVRVLGDTYCVGDYSVDYGSCSSPLQTQIGLIMIGSGVLMAWIGSRSRTVTLSPQISQTYKGVSARIRWGAK